MIRDIIDAYSTGAINRKEMVEQIEAIGLFKAIATVYIALAEKERSLYIEEQTLCPDNSQDHAAKHNPISPD